MRDARGVVCIFSLFVSATFASPAFAQDAAKPPEPVKHAPSGWVFPGSVGEFVRSEKVEFVGATNDAVAHYQRTANGLRTTATVYVYPPNSQAADAPLAGARRALEIGLANVGMAQSWSEGPFRAGKTPELVGEKTFYKIGIGPDSSQTNLYYFDTGNWVIKFRLSVQKTEKESFQLLDAFVRDQPWSELGLNAENCTGSACRLSRPIAVHGALPEQLALLLTGAKLKEVFPPRLEACDASALAASLTAPDSQGAAAEPIRVVAACAQDKRVRASFLRMDLGAEILDSIESKSPDGLSLRGPLTFMARSDGKDTIFTMLFDGPLDAATVEQMVGVLKGKASTPFATADKNGKNASVKIRFIDSR
jgi:hypothetical protein